jgi:hypothetical protein
MDNIFAQIRQELTDFYDQHIVIAPGYAFNQYQTIKRVLLYLNSKFEDASLYNGREKLFFNIVNAPCEVATTAMNLDTKNIRLLPDQPKSWFSTLLLEKELKQWLKKSKMGQILNQIADELPRYGWVVLEKIKGGARVCDIRRVVADQTVKRIRDSRFIDLIYYMTPSELIATGWEGAELAVQLFGNDNAPDTFEGMDGSLNQIRSTPYIKVIKRYGEVPEYWLGKTKSDKLVRALFIVAGAEQPKRNPEGEVTEEQGIVLFKSKWNKEWPLMDFHYVQMKGRLMGMGIPEMLFMDQERMNEIKNQKRVSMELSSLHLFQTKDRLVVQNALTDLMNGDILNVHSEISPIVNEERNIPAFDNEEKSYLAHADRLTFASSAIRGDTLQASTPATNASISLSQSKSTFGFKMEQYALGLQEFFNDLVLPELLTELSPEHIMRFTGSPEELDRLDDAAADLYANDCIYDRFLRGENPNRVTQAQDKQKALDRYKKLGENRFLKIKDALYDDINFEFDFNLNNEQLDPQSVMTNTFTVLQALAQNPALLDDPRLKPLFYRYAETIGVSPAEIELADARKRRDLSAVPTPGNEGGSGYNPTGSTQPQVRRATDQAPATKTLQGVRP